jgi:predicted AlkP superfamily pyrophosphatase or phosphodiesterase
MTGMNRSRELRGWGRLAVSSALCAIAAFGAAVASPQTAAQPVGQPAANAPAAAHSVVLIAVSGLRWDQPERSPHLLALARRGAWAPHGMLPAYPAQEAPNLFSMATGLYPGHHGIVADAFQDPQRGQVYSISDAASAAQGSWYSGTPLWSLAEKNGIKTACIGWTGCEAEIAGVRPTYRAAAGHNGAEGSLRQALTWLHLPAEQRPRLIAVVLGEPGRAARAFGPEAAQTGAAVRSVDAALGRFETELKSTGQPVDLVIVSDRGFASPEGGWITLDQLAPLQPFHAEGLLLYAAGEPDRARAYTLLKKASSEFVSYRLKDLPADLHMNANPRLGDPVVIATGAYALRVSAAPAAAEPRGLDGFDPGVVPAMKAVFIAAGPDIVAGKTVEPFQNVNLYPWLAHMLGLNAPKSDGSLNILSATLRDNGESQQ